MMRRFFVVLRRRFDRLQFGRRGRRRGAMRTKLRDRVLRPAALSGLDAEARQPFGLLLPESARRQSKTIAEQRLKCAASEKP